MLLGQGECVGLQYTSSDNHAARRLKMMSKQMSDGQLVLHALAGARWKVWLWSFRENGTLREEVLA